MATISGSSKYTEGHPVVLKEQSKLSSPTRQKFNSLGYYGGKSVFTLVTNLGKQQINNSIELSNGPAKVYLKDEKNKIIVVKGTNSAINGSFNHHGKTGMSETNLLTEVKELISMWMFESLIEKNKLLTEDDVIKKLGNKRDSYRTVYYTSAVKQATELKKIIKGSGYTYERQAQGVTKKIYDNARKLSRKANDNWNPADVWMIHKSYDIKNLYDINNISELNESIAQAYNKRKLIPISLKQVTDARAHLEVNDPARILQQKLDIDLSIKRIMLSESFSNFTVETVSGFNVRGGYKGSNISLSVSLEGKMAGTKYQLGAVDAKAFPKYMQKAHGYEVRNGSPVINSEQKEAKNELQQILKKYGAISTKMRSYDDIMSRYFDGDDLTRSRFSNIISYLYAITVAPKTPQAKEETLRHCYYSSKKVSEVSCMYVVIK